MFFYTIRLKLLQINAINKRNTPNIDALPCIKFMSFYDITETVCTNVIPKKAIKQPSTSRLVKTLLSINLDNIAVVIISPPRVNCQIDPSIKFKAKFENILDKMSRTVGIKTCFRGAFGF
jgi:hypothetical protein